MRGGSATGPPDRACLFTARVTENVQVGRDHMVLGFEAPASSPKPLPGQFYMLGTGPGRDPLLRRPFCYFRTRGGAVQILYKIRGRGTGILGRISAGGMLDVLGPLGRPYPRPGRGMKPLVVAGGVAVASVYSFVQALKRRAEVVFGAKSEADLVMVDELAEVSGKLHVFTEDGSSGSRGTVLDAMKEISPGPDSVVYACGPRGMVKAVAGFCADRGIGGYASLEEFMACGVGACMGCVVATGRGYARVCKEGPVFRLGDVFRAGTGR